MRRLLISMLLYLLIAPVASNAEELYESQLNRGIRNSDVYSYILIKKASENKSDAIKILKKALIYSPDLPAVYFELSKASFSFSPHGILDSIDYIVQGIDAYLRSFWTSFKLTGSLFFSLILSFILTIAFIIMIRLFSDISLISHDIKETNFNAFLLLVIIIPLSLISPLLSLACILILLGIYMRKIDRIVVYLFLLLLVFSPFVFKTVSFFINTSSSGTIKSIAQVNEAKGNNYAISALKDNGDYTALFSYALALKREGYYHKAIAIYKRLIEDRPDPKIYINLANCYVGLNKLEEAVKYYLKAINIKPRASAYYNLSQISREMLDFKKGNEYFRSAVSLDRTAVSDYTAIYGRSPNRLVVDETLNFTELWKYAMEKSKKVLTFGVTIISVWFMSAISLALLASFYLLSRPSKHKAYRCSRCNVILCAKCEKHLIWGQTCPQCYKPSIKPDELDVKERVARLLSIYARQKRRRDMMRIFSFILPGLPQLYAGKIFYGFIFLWPFLFFLLIPFTNSIFVTSNLLLFHSLLKWTAIFIAIVLYIASNMITRHRISKGWL